MYYESLNEKAKQPYHGKLFCVGLSIHDDPYFGGTRRRLLAKSNHACNFPHLPSWGAILGVPIALSMGVETTSNIFPYKPYFPPIGEYIK